MMVDDVGRSGAEAPSGHEASPSAAISVASSRSRVPNAKWPEWYRALSSIAYGIQPEQQARAELLMLGFIEDCEQTKLCRTCGRPQTDFRYLRITKGGSAFIDAAAIAMEARQGGDPQERHAKHDSAGLEEVSPKTSRPGGA
jgi:hypothetical protein